jgi:hypothetical protein
VHSYELSGGADFVNDSSRCVFNNNNNNKDDNNNLLQFGCHPVAVVILHVYKI